MDKEVACLIDADTIIYLACYDKDQIKTYKDVFNDCDNIVSDILNTTQASYYAGYLTDGSFRYKLAKQKPYKGNRIGIPKPKYFGLAKEYLLSEHQFITEKDLEADDLCIMAHTTIKSVGEFEPIIASPDKDLRQISGVFYDYKKKETEEVDTEAADRNLWKQVLTGDAGDNIPGLAGIGEIKANKILDITDNYKKIVLDYYITHYGEYEGITKFTENYQLVKMLETRSNFELYQPQLIKVKNCLDEW